MTPGSLPFEYPFRWRNEDLTKMAGVTEEAAALLEQRDRDLEDFLATLGGGGKPYATLVVAAADSTAPDRASADYVCSGTADQDTIQEALAVVDNAGVGGTVLLLEGNYQITDGIEVGDGGLCELRGMGRSSFLDASASTADYIIRLGGIASSVRGLYMMGSFTASGVNHGILQYDGQYQQVCDNIIQGTRRGIAIGVPDHIVVTGNEVQTAYSLGIFIGVNSSSDGRWIVADNIVTATATAGEAGIRSDGHNGIISRNVCSTNAGDGILVTAEGAYVTGNLCQANTGYGIQISASAVSNRVVGNVLRGNTAGPLLDSGTTTELSWPAHATYGDNFS